jgi:pyruvate formate lyase activating enzyme
MAIISRRQFLCLSAAYACSAATANAFWPFGASGPTLIDTADIRGTIFKGDAPETPWKWSKEAYHYRTLSGGKVTCTLCPNHCLLAPGDRSVCRSRVNLGGRLYSLAYADPCAIHIDPVEKKPLFHFLPATTAFSLATAGCNFRCLNCQNWEISQKKPHEVRHSELFPTQAVQAAEEAGARSVAFTYSEPVTFFEYMLDTARQAKASGLKALWISNGYINHEPLLELCQAIDGANVNLKSYSDAVYRKLNGGRLQPVLDTFATLHEQGIHFEMTNLVVPGYTDDPKMVKEMVQWILDHLGPDHPLHFLRFFPRYQLDRLPPTPVSTLTDFRHLALEAGIRYVYVGNVAGHEGNHTYCHQCHRLIIERQGYTIPTYHLVGDRCKFCQARIPGVWPAQPGGLGASVSPGVRR